jgi:hypothetical protein
MDISSPVDTAGYSVAVKTASLGAVCWICTSGTEAALHSGGIIGARANNSISLWFSVWPDADGLLTGRTVADLTTSALNSLRSAGAIERREGVREKASKNDN